jgi:DNA adenine methylase
MGRYCGYAPEDFQKLLQLLATLKGTFMLSCYPSELPSSFVQRTGWRIIELDLPRPAGGGRKTKVLTINYDYRDIVEVQAA